MRGFIERSSLLPRATPLSYPADQISSSVVHFRQNRVLMTNAKAAILGDRERCPPEIPFKVTSNYRSVQAVG
jgi:hypothetical protein